jgi:predicted transcriptional regulator
MLAGHESSMTTAGSYWHMSHYNLVSYCEHEFRLMKLSDQDIAAMLGVTASAISQSISKAGNIERWSKQRTAIYDRVNRLKVSTALELVSQSKEIRTKKSMQYNSGSSAAPPASERKVDWQRVDLLLGLRLKLNLSLEAFKELLVAEHELSFAAADLLIETYQELLTETGFDDFEPISSELVGTAPKFARGVRRGQDERRRFLANAYQAFSTDPAHMQSLQALCTGWRIHVAADSPFIVAKNPSQALEYVQTLVMLGVAPAQICFHRVNYPKEKLSQLIALGAKEVSFGRTRVSRGPPRLKQKEIALNVEQLRQSRAPDGRDLHRAIFVMSIALTLQTTQTA